MPIPLSAPVLALLLALPGIPGLPGLRLRAPKVVRVAEDSLPPRWKPASRLALEKQFVTDRMPPLGTANGVLRVQGGNDPRRLRIGVDPSAGTVRTGVEFGDVTLGAPMRRSLESFSREQPRASFQRQWADRNRQSINSLGANTATAGRTTGLSFKLPVDLPKPVQSILGPGGPALNVSGSESIRLSGTSNWTNQQTGLLGQRRSLFPSLDMQQDLDIRLEGQLSDRIKVNLLQNSANQISLSNRIAINYKGDEDDLVQALDLGNTSLSLPGTQYVSYSGKNEGLFGAKLATRLGPLDWSVLASKQEGRSERASFSGGAAKQSFAIGDYNYIKGQYFFLYDPNDMFRSGLLYELSLASLQVFIDDGNNNNNTGNVVKARADVDPGGFTNVRVAPGDTLRSARGQYDFKYAGSDKDYELIRDIYRIGASDGSGRFVELPVLKLSRGLAPEASLAATYVLRRRDPRTLALVDSVFVGGQRQVEGADTVTVVRMLRPQRELLKVAGSVYDTSSVMTRVRELELKNFYALQGFRIDPGTFKLSIEKGQDDPPKVTVRPDGSAQAIPYIEVLGLDGFDQSGGSPVPGHDGRVDGTGAQEGARYFIDYENGLLFFLDPHPFAPRLDASGPFPFDAAIGAVLNRRLTLTGGAGSETEPNPGIYDKVSLRDYEDKRYVISVDLTAARSGGEINLGRGNVLEGSDAVTVNGQRLERGRDYEIDYDLGRVTLKRQLAATDNLNIDYAYAPLFQQAGKTLIGSAFQLEGRDKRLGGAFMYESKGAQDLRPRLGEEPSRTLIGDLNTDWTFRPAFLTRLVDRLPLVRTSTPSEFQIQGEVGMSFPNPNTRNEVYVDDMEGVRDAVSLSMGPERWRWSSVPTRADVIVGGSATLTRPFTQLPGYTNAEVHWYSPPAAVKERDLRPTLEEAQGALNSRQTLAISIPRRPTALTPLVSPNDTMWAGLTYALDPYGLDLSRSQFIEIWVNDFNDWHSGGFREARLRGDPGAAIPSAKLHIDLGVVSEDQMRAPNRPPNRGLPDTEDTGPNPDGQLSVAGAVDEDTGYDRAKNETRSPLADLTTSGLDDQEGDNFRSTDGSFRNELDSRRYRFTNGPEGNKNIYPFPDTEDLNSNGVLDEKENYFEYTIDLADRSSPLLVSDVRRDYVVSDSTNGWRRFRIPINDENRVQFGSPDLTIARHLRIWVEGMQKPEFQVLASVDSLQRPMLLLGGIDIVGSRWQATALTPDQERRGTTVTLSSVNSIDDREAYVPPFDPGQTRTGSQELTRREQSLSLEFAALGGRDSAKADTVEAFKSFSVVEDYSRYGNLRWFAAVYKKPGTLPASNKLYYFVRFASDDRGADYYEYKRRLPPSSAPRAIRWDTVGVSLDEISRLKLLSASLSSTEVLRLPFGAPGDSVIIRGRPSFTRLRRISFGVIHDDPALGPLSGQLWFNEFRATDIKKNVGRANRMLVRGRMANLMSYSATWDQRGEDFLTVGESRGTGTSTNLINASTTIELSRFAEGTGVQLPVTLGYNLASSKPRFTAGDDIVRSDAQSSASETRSETRTVSTSYSRAWSDRSNPFLRYTLGGVTANWARTEALSRSPQGRDSSVAYSAGVGYQISPRRLLTFDVPVTKAKFRPLPERLYWNYSVNQRTSQSYDRRVVGSDSLIPRSLVSGRQGMIDFGADTRPFDFLSHRLEGRRNLNIDGVKNDTLGFINFGRLVSWRQSMDANFAIQKGSWVRPSFRLSSSYSQANGPELSRDLRTRSIGNGQSGSVSWELPFDKLVAGGQAALQAASRARAADTTLPDSVRRARPAGPPVWRSTLARFGSVRTELSFNRSSSDSRTAGQPGVGYVFGFGNQPGGVNQAEIGNQSSRGADWRFRGDTRIQLLYGSQLSTRGNYGDRRTLVNGVENRTVDWRFPDVDVDYGRIAEVVKLTRYLQAPRLRTAYSHSSQVDYTNGYGARSSTSESDDWRPFIGISGSLKNQTSLDFRWDRRHTQRETFLYGNSVQTDDNNDINVTMNRSYSQGQKVSFLGKTSTVRSNVTLGLTAVYSSRKGETVNRNVPGPPQNPIQESRLSLDGNGTYGFSSNVTGSLRLGFSQNQNRIRGIISRSITVQLRGQFTF